VLAADRLIVGADMVALHALVAEAISSEPVDQPFSEHPPPRPDA